MSFLRAWLLLVAMLAASLPSPQSVVVADLERPPLLSFAVLGQARPPRPLLIPSQKRSELCLNRPRPLLRLVLLAWRSLHRR